MEWTYLYSTNSFFRTDQDEISFLSCKYINTFLGTKDEFVWQSGSRINSKYTRIDPDPASQIQDLSSNQISRQFPEADVLRSTWHGDIKMAPSDWSNSPG